MEDVQTELMEEAKMVVLEYLTSAVESEGYFPDDPSLDAERILSRSCSSCQNRSLRNIRSLSAPSIHGRILPEVLDGSAGFKKEELREVRNRRCSPDIRSKLAKSIAWEIKTFNKSNLRRLSGAIGGPDNVKAINSEVLKFDKTRLRNVCRRSLQSIDFKELTIVRSCELEEEFEIPETPLTDVTRRIEEISLCIMKENPCLLDNHLGELLVPLEIEEAISYELFASVAKSVMKKKLSCLATSVWSKAAIACFLTKEVVFSGMISEVDVCSLVDYASRFIAENAFDEINEEVAVEMKYDKLMLSGKVGKEQKEFPGGRGKVLWWLQCTSWMKKEAVLSTITVSAIISVFWFFLKWKS